MTDQEFGDKVVKLRWLLDDPQDYNHALIGALARELLSEVCSALWREPIESAPARGIWGSV